MTTTKNSLVFCKCGCGREVKSVRSGSLYCAGHHTRDPKWRAKNPAPPCSSEKARKISEANKAKHASGTWKQRETYSTPESRRKLSESLKAKWASGTRRRISPQAEKRRQEKVREAQARAKADGRRLGILALPKEERLKVCSKGGLTRTPEKDAQIKALGLAKKGVPNIGRGAANEENHAAKDWVIRDPQGVVHRFRNLSHWARNHAHLFYDDNPAAETPHWKRIAHGISSLLSKTGAVCSYRGWVAVSVTEQDEGEVDLLDRRSS